MKRRPWCVLSVTCRAGLVDSLKRKMTTMNSKRRAGGAPKPRPLAILIEATDGRSDRWTVRADPEEGRESIRREYDDHALATDYAGGVAFVAQCRVLDQTRTVGHKEGVDAAIALLTAMLPSMDALREREVREDCYMAPDTLVPAAIVHVLIAAVDRLRAERDNLLWQLSLVPSAGEA